VPILVSPFERFSLGAISLPAPRARHRSAAIRGQGVLVVGGIADAGTDELILASDGAAYLDLVEGSVCTPQSSDCDLGAVPPARVDHVLVELDGAFASDCPSSSGIVVGLGRDASGEVLSDLFLFDPAALLSGAFQVLSAPVLARAEATAVATLDCRVLFFGGVGSDGALVTDVDVLTFSDDGVAARRLLADATLARSRAPAVRTDDGADDLIVLAGIDLDGAPLDTAFFYAANVADPLVLCPFTDATCNGASASLRCPRAEPAVARIENAGDVVAFLVAGGDEDASCSVAGSPIEVLRSSTQPPYHAFLPTSSQPALVHRSGLAAIALGPGRVALIGGIDAGGFPVTKTEELQLLSPLGTGSSTVDAAFESLPDLEEARAHHTVHRLGGSVAVLGGIGTGGVLSSVEVFSIALP
jgi:hypothetical protein